MIYSELKLSDIIEILPSFKRIVISKALMLLRATPELQNYVHRGLIIL